MLQHKDLQGELAAAKGEKLALRLELSEVRARLAEEEERRTRELLGQKEHGTLRTRTGPAPRTVRPCARMGCLPCCCTARLWVHGLGSRGVVPYRTRAVPGPHRRELLAQKEAAEREAARLADVHAAAEAKAVAEARASADGATQAAEAERAAYGAAQRNFQEISEAAAARLEAEGKELRAEREFFEKAQRVGSACVLAALHPCRQHRGLLRGRCLLSGCSPIPGGALEPRTQLALRGWGCCHEPAPKPPISRLSFNTQEGGG